MGLSIEHPAPSITFHGTVSIKHHLHVGGSNALVQCSQCRQPSTVQPRHPRRSRPCSTMPASGARVRGQLQARQVICYYSHHHHRVLGSLRASHLTVFLSYYACTNRDWHGIDGRVARVPPNERLRDHRGKVGRDLIGRRSAGTWCRQLTDSAICTYYTLLEETLATCIKIQGTCMVAGCTFQDVRRSSAVGGNWLGLVASLRSL
jgi:hypothetical protein